jgi:hypothetical protein
LRMFGCTHNLVLMLEDYLLLFTMTKSDHLECSFRTLAKSLKTLLCNKGKFGAVKFEFL